MSETRKVRGGRIMRARVADAIVRRARAAEQAAITFKGLRAWAPLPGSSFFGVERGVQSTTGRMHFGRLGVLVIEAIDE